MEFHDGQARLAFPVDSQAQVALLHVHGLPQDVRVDLLEWTAGNTTLSPGDAGRTPTQAELDWSFGTGLGVTGPCRARGSHAAAVFLCPSRPQDVLPTGQQRILLHATSQAGDGGQDQPWSGTAPFSFLAPGSAGDASRSFPVVLHASTALPAATLEVASNLLRQAGLHLDVMTVPWVQGPVQVDMSTLRSARLMELAQDVPADGAAHVFLMDTLETVDGAGDVRSVAGFTPTLPGAPGLGGLAAMALVRRQVDQDYQAVTLAHELLHLTGLFHVLEYPAPDGSQVVDQLEDTPEVLEEAVGFLMHHTPLTSSGRISPMQRALVMRHPSVQ